MSTHSDFVQNRKQLADTLHRNLRTYIKCFSLTMIFVMVRSSTVTGTIMTINHFQKISAAYLAFYYIFEFSEKQESV